MDLNNKVSVLIPVYNEEKTISTILNKLFQLDFVYEIIIVNDCSTDRSLEIIESVKNEKCKIFSLDQNSGKTAAIFKAKEMASGDIIVIQDADLEYDPQELESVVTPIINNIADVVYGSRFLVKKATRVLYFYHYLANKSLTFLSNLFTNLNMSDIETCYKAFRTSVFKDMPLTSSGFGMEVEITAMISKIPLRIYEVPISYYGRTYEEGKKIGLKDGIWAIWYILYFNIFAQQISLHKDYINNISKKFELEEV